MDSVRPPLEAGSSHRVPALCASSTPCLQAPQLHLNALLVQQAAAAELREGQRQERQAQLLRVQLAFAQQHMAVCECGLGFGGPALANMQHHGKWHRHGWLLNDSKLAAS